MRVHASSTVAESSGPHRPETIVAEVLMGGFDQVKVRHHRLREAELGFPLLRGCASTEAISLVLYLEGLGPRAGRPDGRSERR